MIARAKNSVTYALSPSEDDAGAIAATLAAYGRAMEILDGTKGANLVALHEEAYERIRAETGLPSRLATLALRDHSRRQPGDPVADMPLDGKVFAVKGPESLSLSTVAGRCVVPYAVSGYGHGWTDFAEARLHATARGFEISVGIESGVHPQKENDMSTESILSRVGRVIAGTAHGAVEALERGNTKAVAEAAVREIDAAIQEARTILGKAQAGEFRIKAKIAEIQEELRDLQGKVEAGLAQGREDLVKPVIGLQIDLEAQRAAMERALGDARSDIDEANRALQAARSARADAVARSEALSASQRAADGAGAGLTPAQRNEDRIARSLQAIERVTGTPSRPKAGAAEVEELAKIQREASIEERLAALKEKRN